jgi:hypothetical protein
LTIGWPRSPSVELALHDSVRVCGVCGICVLSESGRTIESTKNRETDFLGVAVLPRDPMRHSSFAPPNNIVTLEHLTCEDYIRVQVHKLAERM